MFYYIMLLIVFLVYLVLLGIAYSDQHGTIDKYTKIKPYKIKQIKTGDGNIRYVCKIRDYVFFPVGVYKWFKVSGYRYERYVRSDKERIKLSGDTTIELSMFYSEEDIHKLLKLMHDDYMEDLNYKKQFE